jgi:hypothetical protein
MRPTLSSLLASVPKRSPLAYLPKHWNNLDLDNLKRKTIFFLCIEAWLQYPLGDQEKWASEGSLNYNTILQLVLFCKQEEKWTEIPYVQLFFYLWDHPEWLHYCHLDIQSLAMLCNPPKQHRERPAISSSMPTTQGNQGAPIHQTLCPTL